MFSSTQQSGSHATHRNDGIFTSQAEPHISYYVYRLETPILDIEDSGSDPLLISDPVTVRMTVVDLDSLTVNLLRMSSSWTSFLSDVILDWFHLASSSIVTLPGGSYCHLLQFPDSDRLALVISGGVNVSVSELFSISNSPLLATVVAPNRYLETGFFLFNQISFVNSFVWSVCPHQIQLFSMGWMDGLRSDSHDQGPFNCVPDGVIFELPTTAWDEGLEDI
jgi:hypothetical protein